VFYYHKHIDDVYSGVYICTHERQRDVTPSKERTMKRGHVTGHKKERQGSTDWY